MPSPQPSLLLRRMAGYDDVVAPDAVDAAPSPLERALATAAFRVADGLAGLGLSVTARRSVTVSAEAAFQDLPSLGLCLMIDPPLPPGAARPGADALAASTGTVVLDPAFVDSLVELQTIGRIDGPARPARRPTRIDAALAQPFATALCEEVAAQLPWDHFGPRPGALRTGTFLAGPGSLPVALTAPNWLVVTLEVALGDGVRPARIDLLLPDATGAADAAARPEEIALPDPGWADAMELAARRAPVRLDAVLPPHRMTLADLVALAPGDVIPLDGAPLEELTLLSGASGRGRAAQSRMPYGLTISVRLGRFGAARAVRLVCDPGPSADRARTAPTSRDTRASLAPPAAEHGAEGTESDMPGPGATAVGAGGGPHDGFDLPDMPDLPDLPDLPEDDHLALLDLPDLPDLP